MQDRTRQGLSSLQAGNQLQQPRESIRNLRRARERTSRCAPDFEDDLLRFWRQRRWGRKSLPTVPHPQHESNDRTERQRINRKPARLRQPPRHEHERDSDNESDGMRSEKARPIRTKRLHGVRAQPIVARAIPSRTRLVPADQIHGYPHCTPVPGNEGQPPEELLPLCALSVSAVIGFCSSLYLLLLLELANHPHILSASAVDSEPQLSRWRRLCAALFHTGKGLPPRQPPSSRAARDFGRTTSSQDFVAIHALR